MKAQLEDVLKPLFLLQLSDLLLDLSLGCVVIITAPAL